MSDCKCGNVLAGHEENGMCDYCYCDAQEDKHEVKDICDGTCTTADGWKCAECKKTTPDICDGCEEPLTEPAMKLEAWHYCKACYFQQIRDSKQAKLDEITERISDALSDLEVLDGTDYTLRMNIELSEIRAAICTATI